MDRYMCTMRVVWVGVMGAKIGTADMDGRDRVAGLQMSQCRRGANMGTWGCKYRGWAWRGPSIRDPGDGTQGHLSARFYLEAMRASSRSGPHHLLAAGRVSVDLRRGCLCLCIGRCCLSTGGQSRLRLGDVSTRARPSQRKQPRSRLWTSLLAVRTARARVCGAREQ